MTWSHYLPAGVLALGAALTAVVGTPHPTPLTRPLAETLPATFLGVPGTDVPIGPDEQRVSGVTAYLNRAYDVGGPGPVLLYVGYHATQQGDNRMHSPSLCLPGAGWTPLSAQVVPVVVAGRTVEVNRYILQKGNSRILVYYWFQGRGRVTAGEAQLKLHAITDAFVSHRDEEALARIVVPVTRQAPEAEIGTTGLQPDSLATRFVAEVIPALQRALPAAP